MVDRIYAVIEDGTIVNTLVADPSLLPMVENEHTVVLDITDMDPQPGVNWSSSDGEFRPPSPYRGWVWDGQAWMPPTPRPQENGPWWWDEESGSWVNA